jgi:WD40 repeat protein/uncharacterized caspase-like protein
MDQLRAAARTALWICLLVPSMSFLLRAQDLGSSPNSQQAHLLRELHVQRGHSDVVTAIVFTRDGHLMATASRDNTVKLWEAATGRELRTLDRYPNRRFFEPVEALTFSPDGKWLAMQIAGGTTIWEVETGHLADALLKHVSSETLFSPAFNLLFDRGWSRLGYSPDGSVLVEAQGSAVAFWNTALTTLGPVVSDQSCAETALAYAPDGKSVAVGCNDGRVKILDPTGSKAAVSWAAGTKAVNALAFSPDGQWLASETTDGIITTWNAADWRSARVMKDLAGKSATIEFTPDGRFLISASINLGGWPPPPDQYHEIRVWDFQAGVLDHTLKAHRDLITAFAVSSSGMLASAAQDHSIKLWHIGTWTEAKTLQSEGPLNWMTKLALSSDGQSLASSGTQVVHLWDLNAGNLVRRFSANVHDFAFGPDSKAVLVADNDHATSLDATTGAVVHTADLPPNPSQQWRIAAKFGPSGAWLIDSVIGNPSIRVSDANTGEVLDNILNGDQNPLELVLPTASPNGRWLAWPSAEGAINLWDLKNHRSAPGPTLTASQNLLNDGPDAIRFSPDGSWLAWCTGRGELKLWDLQHSREAPVLISRKAQDDPRLPTPAPLSGDAGFAFSHDGQRLAASVGGFSGVPIPSGTKVNFQGIRIWNIGNGTEEASIATKEIPPFSLAFSPDGRLLVGRSTSDLFLWDLTDAREIEIDPFSQHQAGITSVEFRPDGRYLFTSSADGTAHMWDPATGKLLLILLPIDQDNDWAAITPDGLFDGSPAAWERFLWRFNGDTFDVAPVEIFFNEYFHPGLLADLMTGEAPKAPTNIAAKDRRQPDIQLTLAGQRNPDGAIASRTVTVRLHVTEKTRDKEHPNGGSGVRDVRLFRNGSLVKMWHGDVLRGKSSSRLEAAVTLMAGENKFTAYGFNHDNIKSSDATLTITGADSLKRKGTAYILAIGVDHYANERFNLRYAVADAQEFATVLKSRQEKLGSFEHVEVIQLLDAQATRANVLATFKRLAEQEKAPLPAGAPPDLTRLGAAQPEDAVFIYFAGHGTADGPRFFLIPHDLGYEGARDVIGKADLTTIEQNSISDEQLNAAFEGIDAGRIVLVIDACNSGQALEAEEKRRGPMNSKGLAQLAYEKGMYILTASQGYQQAQEISRYGHGLLTYALVHEGLEEGKASSADKAVYLREWLDFAAKDVPELQLSWLQEAKISGRAIGVKTKKGSTPADLLDLGLQRPRVFYRREPEAHPVVVARP